MHGRKDSNDKVRGEMEGGSQNTVARKERKKDERKKEHGKKGLERLKGNKLIEMEKVGGRERETKKVLERVKKNTKRIHRKYLGMEEMTQGNDEGNIEMTRGRKEKEEETEG